MEKSNNWALPVCVVMGLAAFGAARFFMADDKKGVEAAPLLPVVDAGVKDDQAPVDAKQAAGPAVAAKKNEPTPAPRRSAILQRINVPLDGQPDQFGKSPFDIHDLAINADGTRLITKSKKAVIYWDTKTGKALQTYLPPKPAWDYQEPKADRIFMSPDTRVVATLTVNKSNAYFLELHETESKRLLGTCVPDKDNHLLDQMLPAFTPSGASMLLHGSMAGGLTVQAVSTSSAAISNVYRGPKGFTKGHVEELLAVPNSPTLILWRRGGKNPLALDVRTGQETAITGITNKPWHLFFERGMDVSADGRYLLVAGLNELQVCDWRTNESFIKLKESDVAFLQPRFTPDGKRFVVMRQPQYDIIHIGGPKGGSREHPPCTLELYDVAGKRQIGKFTLSKEQTVARITGLALSQNGKVVAIANHTSALCLDFEGLFGVAPLPPISRPVTNEFAAK